MSKYLLSGSFILLIADFVTEIIKRIATAVNKCSNSASFNWKDLWYPFTIGKAAANGLLSFIVVYNVIATSLIICVFIASPKSIIASTFGLIIFSETIMLLSFASLWTTDFLNFE